MKSRGEGEAGEDERSGAVSKLRNQVLEFHRAYGQPIVETPAVPSDERVRLRLRLIAEEFFELLEACDVDEDNAQFAVAKSVVGNFIEFALGEDVKLTDVADALADLDYVIEGTRIEFGIDGGPIADEVHRSNLSKLSADGRPVLNEHGKVTKGPNFSPPDIAGELRRQGWRP